MSCTFWVRRKRTAALKSAAEKEVKTDGLQEKVQKEKKVKPKGRKKNDD